MGLLGALAIAASACGPGQPPATSTPSPASSQYGRATLALVGGTLVDGTGALPVSDAVVLIEGDRILAAGPAKDVSVPGGVRTIDVHGGTILPGFINAHVHDGFTQAKLRAWAEGGVTTVRDESAGISSVANLKTTRAEIAQNPHLARLVSAGTMLAVPGGYGYLYVGSADEARQAVEREIDEGADEIKVAMEDGYAGTHGLPKLTPEELRVIVETAHAHGVPVSGHITQAAYLPSLLDAGVDDVAHVPYDTIPDSDLRRMVTAGVYLVPTFTVFRNYGANVDGCVENLRRFVAMGGKVALGNDYDGGPGVFELGIPMYEIEMMAKAGMTPIQIVQAGTSNAASVVNLDDQIGTLTAGKAADILVVDGNPLQDVQALRSVRIVIHAGVEIRSDTP
jgi:imidazolonepropionase-like amidohydrolase